MSVTPPRRCVTTAVCVVPAKVRRPYDDDDDDDDDGDDDDDDDDNNNNNNRALQTRWGPGVA